MNSKRVQIRWCRKHHKVFVLNDPCCPREAVGIGYIWYGKQGASQDTEK